MGWGFIRRYNGWAWAHPWRAAFLTGVLTFTVPLAYAVLIRHEPARARIVFIAVYAAAFSTVLGFIAAAGPRRAR
jgi:hypothetical protein